MGGGRRLQDWGCGRLVFGIRVLQVEEIIA